MWLSLVERCVRDAEVAGSNPVISTITLSTHVLVEIQNPSWNAFREGFSFVFWLLYLVYVSLFYPHNCLIYHANLGVGRNFLPMLRVREYSQPHNNSDGIVTVTSTFVS